MSTNADCDNGKQIDTLNSSSASLYLKKCQRLIGRYALDLSRIQDKLSEACGITNKDGPFLENAFYDTSTLETHQQLCAQFSKCHERSESPSIEEMVDSWRSLLCKVTENGNLTNTKKCTNAHDQLLRKCFALMKFIIGYCLLEGMHYEALEYMLELLRDGNFDDFNLWLLTLFEAQRLEEWQLLEYLLAEGEKRMKRWPLTHGFLLCIECIKLVHKMHTALTNIEQHDIIDELSTKLNNILSNDKKTFLYTQAKALLRSCLIRASRVAKADLQKTGDPIYQREQEMYHYQSVLRSYHPPFFITSKSCSIRSKAANSDDFLRFCASFVDYMDSSANYTWDCLDVGLVREAEAITLTNWRYNLRFGVTIWTLRSLTFLFFIKSTTTIERHMLGSYANCIRALITPQTSSTSYYLHTPKKQIRPSVFRRGSAVDDSFTSEGLDLTTDAALALEISSVNISGNNETRERFNIDKHVNDCRCAFCVSQTKNQAMELEFKWLQFLFGTNTHSELEDFRIGIVLIENKCRKVRDKVLEHIQQVSPSPSEQSANTEKIIKQEESLQKRKRGRPPKNKPQMENVEDTQKIGCDKEVSSTLKTISTAKNFFLLVSYLLRAIFHFLLQQTDLVNSSEYMVAYIKDALDLCTVFPLAHRPHWLLSRLLERHNKRRVSTREEEIELLKLAYEDSKNYGHLFLREWRRRNCLFLANSRTITAWHRALYMVESVAPSLRQLSRVSIFRKMHSLGANEGNSSDLNKNIAICDQDEGENGQLWDNLTFTSEQFRRSIKELPEDLTFVNIVVDHLGVLSLLRCHSSHEPIRIQLCKIGKDDRILDWMRALLLASDKSVRSNNNDPKIFWEERKKLNEEMKALLMELQSSWFSAAAPLLLPLNKTPPSDSTASMQQNKLIRQFTGLGMSKASAMTLSHFLDSLDCECWQQLARLLYFWDRSSTDNEILLSSQPNSYSSSTNHALEEILNGWSSYRSRNKEGRESRNSELKLKYTLLVVPPSLSHLPWECLPIFQLAPLVTRIPSFHIFEHIFQRTKNIPKEVDGRNSYYVLNPSGDLAKTQERLTSFVDRFVWKGVVGRVPSREEIRHILTQHDLFLYMGHGSGGRYFGRTAIRESDCRAVSILMGCSSVRIVDEGPGFDGRSAVYEYLIARCPSVVGCLWMVTDGEIDRFFMALIEYCFAEMAKKEEKDADIIYIGKKKETSRRQKITADDTFRLLVRGVVHARQACRLPYLTGAAVVTYGLPVAALVKSQPEFSNNDSLA